MFASIAYPFWFFLLLLTIVWYFTVTALVAFRGARDIRQMIKNENSNKNEVSV